MARCSRDIFSVNCVFLTTCALALALVIPLLMPSPNQPIITACQQKNYRALHSAVDSALAELEKDMRARPDRWQGRSRAHVDDLDFGGGRKVMHIAALHGDESIVRYMVKRGAGIHVRKEIDERTPLHMAATFNTVEVVKLLLKLGAEVDPRAKDGWTPLLKAVLLSNHEIVQALIDAGADANARVDGSFNAMQCALIYSDDRMAMILLKAGAYVEEDEPRYDLFEEMKQRLLDANLLQPNDIPERSFVARTNSSSDMKAGSRGTTYSELHPGADNED